MRVLCWRLLAPPDGVFLNESINTHFSSNIKELIIDERASCVLYVSTLCMQSANVKKNGSFLALRARTFLVTLKCRFGPKKQTAVANDNDDVSYNNDIKANQITC